MRCPKCYSENCQVKHDVTTQGYSAGKGCCGLMFLGPLGLLCGLCGSGNVLWEDEYWICNNCGKKFDKFDGKQAEEVYKARQVAKQKILEVGSNLDEGSAAKLMEQKEKIRRKLREKLSADELEQFIFFEPGCEDDRVTDLFYKYRELGLDFKDECIYFIYCENSLMSNYGIIVASDSIYFKQGLEARYYEVLKKDISKVYIEDGKIRIGKEFCLSFKNITSLESKNAIIDILREIYVENIVIESNESNCKKNAICGHISGGFVTQRGDKLYYVDKDFNSLVVRSGNNEMVSLNKKVNALVLYDNKIYITDEENYVSSLDPETYKITHLFYQNCRNINICNDKIACTNYSDKQSLYIMNIDGSNARKITDDKVKDITMSDEWIYYINGSDKRSIYKIKYDGSNRTKIYGGVKCKNLMYDNGYCYFISDSLSTYNEFYRVSENGDGLMKIMEGAKDYVMSNEEIYVAREDAVLYMNRDDLENLYYFIKNTKANHLNIVNGYLYYSSPQELVGHAVTHRVKCEGGKIEKL